MKVLYLTPWYPSDRDKMEGLFVLKHVEAVQAQGVDVRVIYSQGWHDMWQQWRALKRSWGLPDVVQLNVIQKQGLLALWLKRRYGIPYVIIEHWTGYLPENRRVSAGGWHTRLMKRICREAEVVTPVSRHLIRAMQALGFEAKRWEKVNNVVDDFFFDEPASEQPRPSGGKRTIRLLHISCVDEAHKNIKGILRAVQTLSREYSLRLSVVGISVDHAEVKAYARELGLEQIVHFTGELTPREVAEEFDQTDIFVLNSNYENLPVVIAESVVKGVPVVSTNVGGIPEMIDEQSGILIEPQNDEQLTEALRTMITRYGEYDRRAIRRNGQQYSYAEVGKQLRQIYESVSGH